VARRACLRIKTAQLRLDALDDVDAGELARGFEQLGTLAESSPMLDEVQAALDAAGGDIRSRVAVLHYREGHAAKDIASSLRIPLNTVLSHLRRFRLELQKTMARDHACNIAALAAHS
jgi:DNA-directed RNA polymerase specialized sigma24 family protein